MTTPSSSTDIQIRMIGPRGPVRTFLTWLGITLLFSIMWFVLFSQENLRLDDKEAVVWIAVFAVVCGTIVSYMMFKYDRSRFAWSYLSLEPHAIRWYWPPVMTELPYGDLWAAHREGRGRSERLVMRGRTGKQVIQLSIRNTWNAASIEPLLASISERVKELPDGARLLDEMAVRRAVAALMSRRATATLCLAAILVLIFGVEVAAGALRDPARILALGANSAERVADGELFRLATANLLHAGLWHLAANVLVLVSLGAMYEPLLGAGKFLSIFLISALAGAAASSMIAQHEIAVGASTGIAGLLGAYAVILWRRPHQLPMPTSKWDWLNLAYAFILPALIYRNIDHAGHLGGFVAGVLLMSAFLWRTDLLELHIRYRLLSRLTAGFLIVLFLTAAAIVFQQVRGLQIW
jgi:membrane associated rhomboid family serine protease